MNKNYQKMASDLAKAGRGGDDQILHVSKSELAGLGSLLPSGKLPINPETGQPEALIFTLPALLISMAIGAGTGAISGGVTAKEKGIPLWEGILTGAGTGAATGMVTAGIGGALTPASTAGIDAASQGIQAGAGEILDASLEEGVKVAVDESLKVAGEKGLESATENLTKDVLKDAMTNFMEPPTPGLLAPSALPDAGGIIPSPTGATPPPGVTPTAPTTPTTVDPGIANPGAVSPQAPTPGVDGGDVVVETLVGTAEDAGAEVVVDGAVEGAEEGFFEGIKNSALELKEEAIEKLGPNNVEFLDWYTDNPVAMMAPAAITQATQRWELDEDDDDGYYSGPYEKSWETGPGVSWAAKDGGEVRRRKPEPKYDSESLSRIKGLLSMIDRTMNPSIPGKYNPLSDADIQMKLRPSMSGGMHRVGVRLPFRDGGVASSNRFQRGLGSLRRP